MAPGDFYDYMQGTTARIKRENTVHNSLRRLAFFTLLPHVKDGAGLSWSHFCSNYWPLPSDEVAEQDQKYSPQIDADLYEQMIKAHNLKISKARRAKDA